MYRLPATLALLTALLLGGCDARPEGVVHVETSGALELIHSVRYTVDSQDWDLRVDCFSEGNLYREILHVTAYDNTFEDGLTIDLMIEDFGGDGTYHRTSNQPSPALYLTLHDDDTDDWTLDSRSGGSCDFTVEYSGRQGTVECSDVWGRTASGQEFEDVQVSGDWTCTGLYWNDRSYYDFDYDRDDDDLDEEM